MRQHRNRKSQPHLSREFQRKKSLLMKSVDVSAENSFPYCSLLQRNITAQQRHVLSPVILRLLSSRKV